MTTPVAVARDVLDDVRKACESSGRETSPGEVLRALSVLTRDEVAAVQRLAKGPLPARPLGPDAFIDIAKGTAPHVAAARELGGYYALKAERDALAQLTTRPAPVAIASEDDVEDEVEESDDIESEDDVESEDDAQDDDAADEEAEFTSDSDHTSDDDDGDADDAEEDEDARERPLAAAAVIELSPAAKRAVRKKAVPVSADERRVMKDQEQALVTLFAYHRDPVRVAQELGLPLSELNQRVESLGLRRRIHRLLEMTTDIELFSPERMSTSKNETKSTPMLVRRRGEKADRASTTAADLPLEGEDDRPFERSNPAARTTPVNAHGTRVYRRTPAAKDKDGDDSSLAPRREYVRESRRKERQTPKARSVNPRAVPEVVAPKVPSKFPFVELQASGGKEVLERLLGDEKANPRLLAAKLAEKFDGPADRALNESDLRLLLAHHGLAAAFSEREKANARFLIGFHQGARSKLLNALHLAADELDGYLSRLGLLADLETVRAERGRLELGRRKIHDRISQVLTRAPYLDDLGVLPTIDREVREHVEALLMTHAAAGDATFEKVREELGVEPNACAKLLRRYELIERAPPPKPAEPA